jgi:hypothetical protein
VRDPKPLDREGYRWKWNHDQMQWIEYALPQTIETVEVISSDQIAALSSSNIIALTSEQISGL